MDFACAQIVLNCNVKGVGCQDKFGSNMRPGGGIFGSAIALGAGTEHQGYGTPHLHGEIHVNSIFQYHIGRLTLKLEKLLEFGVFPQFTDF